MKFAVIEYSSKSGKVWHHREGHPNYLEDPQKVIDPTSFGCYVSALKGEHIPITWLARPNIFKKIYKRLTGFWPPYSLKYLRQFDTILLVHQISDAHEVLRFAERLKKELPHIFVIGVPTQPFGILKNYLDSHAEQKEIFRKFMDSCDIFLGLVKSTHDWYQNLTKTPVVYLPQIYPTHFAARHAAPPKKKEKIIFVAGVTDRPNIAQGFAAARELQKEFPDCIIHVTQIPGVPMDFSELSGARYEIQPFREWQAQLDYLSHVKLVINTDYTSTRGRVQTDAAAVGTPSLGGNSDGSVDLFPELASTPETPTKELIEKGRKLLTDTNYYRKITDYASDKLKKYDYEESAARLQVLVKQYRTEKSSRSRGQRDPVNSDDLARDSERVAAAGPFDRLHGSSSDAHPVGVKLPTGPAEHNASKRFLIRHLGNMGDHVFLIPPVLATLKRVYPNCHITLVTAWGYKEKKRSWPAGRSLGEGWGKRNQGGFCIHLMQTNPDVDQLVHYDDTKLSLNGDICEEDGQRFPTWNKNYYDEQKKGGEYENVFELDFGLGYEDNPIQKMYKAINLPQEDYSEYKLYFTEKDLAVAKAVMESQPRPRIVLLEGLEGTTTRGWDPSKIPELSKAITKKYGVPPLWFGSKHIPEFEGRPLTLRENIATLALCDVGVGVMSGPMHFAVAVGLPTLTLYSDHPLHRAAPAFFLNRYIKNPKKYHRTVLGPDQQPYTLLKSQKPDRNLTPMEQKTQQFQDWQHPGRQSTKTGLATITVDEVMLALSDML